MYVCLGEFVSGHVCAGAHRGQGKALPEESLVTRITGSCEPPHVGAEKPGPLHELEALSNAKPSLQPQFEHFQ